MVGHWTHRKRRAQVEPVDERDDVVDELAELRIFRDQLTQPLKTSGCFDLCHESEKRRLASQLWQGQYNDCMAALREARRPTTGGPDGAAGGGGATAAAASSETLASSGGGSPAPGFLRVVPACTAFPLRFGARPACTASQ